jgi:ADP-ribose pyrophosphatase YjhB (NUDIX family)
MAIEVKAMVLLQNNGRILVSKGFDKVKQQVFYRLLGGSVEFGETAEQAVRRELLEEVDSEIADLKLIDVIENIYFYQGIQGHEIDYLYTGTLLKTELTEQNPIPLREEYGDWGFFAEWIPVQDTTKTGVPLYPPYDYISLLKA